MASELRPDTRLSSGGTAQAPVPNEYRAGAAAAASSIRENVTDQAIKHRQASFHIPTSSPPLCASDVALRCTSYPYATAVCLALGELSVTLPKPALQETPGNHTWITTEKRNSLINLMWKERHNEKTLKCMKNTGTISLEKQNF